METETIGGGKIHMCAHECVCVCIYIYIHTYIFIYIYIYLKEI